MVKLYLSITMNYDLEQIKKRDESGSFYGKRNPCV